MVDLSGRLMCGGNRLYYTVQDTNYQRAWRFEADKLWCMDLVSQNNITELPLLVFIQVHTLTSTPGSGRDHDMLQQVNIAANSRDDTRIHSQQPNKSEAHKLSNHVSHSKVNTTEDYRSLPSLKLTNERQAPAKMFTNKSTWQSWHSGNLMVHADY